MTDGCDGEELSVAPFDRRRHRRPGVASAPWRAWTDTGGGGPQDQGALVRGVACVALCEWMRYGYMFWFIFLRIASILARFLLSTNATVPQHFTSGTL